MADAGIIPAEAARDLREKGAFNIARTVKSLVKFGAAGMHIEDQVQQKRCGHRPGKEIVSKQEMVDRIKAAVDARTDPDFVFTVTRDFVLIRRPVKITGNGAKYRGASISAKAAWLPSLFWYCRTGEGIVSASSPTRHVIRLVRSS